MIPLSHKNLLCDVLEGSSSTLVGYFVRFSDSSSNFTYVFITLIDLLVPQSAQIRSFWKPFGLPFSANKGPCAGLGPKPAPGQPRGSLLSALGSYFSDIWDGF